MTEKEIRETAAEQKYKHCLGLLKFGYISWAKDAIKQAIELDDKEIYKKQLAEIEKIIPETPSKTIQ